MIKKIKIAPLVVLGFFPSYILYNLCHSFNFSGMIDYISYMSMILFILFMAAFGKYSNKTKYITYLCSSIGIFFIILNLGIFLYFNYKLNSENLIMVEKDCIQIQFKKNGDCISKQKCDERYHYSYGNYKLNNNIIIVDGEGFNRNYKIKFSVKGDTIKLISKDERKSKYNTFAIVEDNRNLEP